MSILEKWYTARKAVLTDHEYRALLVAKVRYISCVLNTCLVEDATKKYEGTDLEEFVAKIRVRDQAEKAVNTAAEKHLDHGIQYLEGYLEGIYERVLEHDPFFGDRQ